MPGRTSNDSVYLRHFLTIYFNACDTMKLTAAPIAARTAVFNASADVILATMMVRMPPVILAFVEVSNQ